MTLQDDIAEIMFKLNKAANERASLKGEIITNAKGEASFKIRVYSELSSEIELQGKAVYEALEKICTEKGIKIAGR